MLKKLRNKLLLVNLASLSAVTVLSFSLIYFIAYNYLQGIIVNDLRSIPPDVMTNAILSERDQQADAGGDFYIKGIPDLPMDYSRSFVVNINARGKIISVFSRIDLDQSEYLKAVRLAERSEKDMGRIKFAGSKWQYIVTGANRESLVFLNVDDYEQALSRLLFSMAILGGCVLATIFFLSYRFANRAIRPVEESIEKQRRFVADASHELKTPLAIIYSNAEAILADENASVRSQRKWVDRIEEESNRMRNLVDNLLYLAKTEDTAGEDAPFDLFAAAEDEVKRAEAILYERGVKLTMKKYAEAVVVKADEERIRQAILILLDNAVKYTDEGGEVTAEVGKEKHIGYIRISNTGEGIPPEDLPRIFDRFYRADRARTSIREGTISSGRSGRGGFGLGLAIARVVVERSKGRIRATSSNGLTSFTVELPLR
ncbi:MAG: HAMP domain-containing histidine kinase [Clostridiales Family XIII bacterium]|jgi:signal transduction histidine kinase|nr:HAMP domain-containing histidine kinase [Clostridiales Family XIII bacterium]